jgi:hypothetical protein
MPVAEGEHADRRRQRVRAPPRRGGRRHRGPAEDLEVPVGDALGLDPGLGSRDLAQLEIRRSSGDDATAERDRRLARDLVLPAQRRAREDREERRWIRRQVRERPERRPVLHDDAHRIRLRIEDPDRQGDAAAVGRAWRRTRCRLTIAVGIASLSSTKEVVETGFRSPCRRSA